MFLFFLTSRIVFCIITWITFLLSRAYFWSFPVFHESSHNRLQRKRWPACVSSGAQTRAHRCWCWSYSFTARTLPSRKGISRQAIVSSNWSQRLWSYPRAPSKVGMPSCHPSCRYSRPIRLQSPNTSQASFSRIEKMKQPHFWTWYTHSNVILSWNVLRACAEVRLLLLALSHIITFVLLNAPRSFVPLVGNSSYCTSIQRQCDHRNLQPHTNISVFSNWRRSSNRTRRTIWAIKSVRFLSQCTNAASKKGHEF